MKYIIVAVTILIITGFSCTKKSAEDKSCAVDLIIISTQAPVNVTAGNDIIARVTCAGPNLCYYFSHVEIKVISERLYEIRTIGRMPCKATICLDAIYYAESTISIKTIVSGQYILRYYHHDALLKADTVTVN